MQLLWMHMAPERLAAAVQQDEEAERQGRAAGADEEGEGEAGGLSQRPPGDDTDAPAGGDRAGASGGAGTQEPPGEGCTMQ